jgi:hypothetical protein
MGRQVIVKAQPQDALFVAEGPAYIAYFLDGGDLVAVSMNAAGGYIQEIGRAPDAGEFYWDRASRIFSDSSAKIAKDSIVWCRGARRDMPDEGSNGIFVADVRNGTTFATSSGFDGDVAGVGLINGKIYFLTWQFNATADDNVVKCYRADTDLDNLNLFETVTVEKDGHPTTPTWIEIEGLGVSGNGGIFAGLHYLYPPGVETQNAFVHVFFPASVEMPEWAAGVDFNGPQVGAPYGVRSLADIRLHPGEFFEAEAEGGWEQFIDHPSIWFPEEEFDPGDFDRIQTYGNSTGSFAICYLWNLKRIVRFVPTILPFPPAQLVLEIADHPTLGQPEMIVPA